ncbi:MAG: non-ribosomal peptide synthetase, partial [Bosea sp.]|uniref:thioesterase domain-containing protein n=1 Tax=Bosea sp. (in: a-proteobacteria) TaxID=1871050 RepID=UPI0031FEAA24|nr:non-ribosomal peptide synthetase [Bosea sp. (in: a-proteobacteria)]
LGRRAIPVAEGADLAPRDTVELRLARIWEELLGVQPVGIRSDFFALGGHSLLAVRLMARIRQEFGRDLPLATLFQDRTVEHLAAQLRRQQGETDRRALVAMRSQGIRPPFFCVHPVGGNVLCYGDLARHLGSDQPFYGLQVPDCEGELFLTEIDEMARHYAAAVREVQPQGPYRLGGWSMGGVVAFEMARQLEA